MNALSPNCYILLNDTPVTDVDDHFLSVQTKLRHQIANLLRHEHGASVEELMMITRSDLEQIHRCIRMIINDGGAVTLLHDAKRACVFYLLD